MIDYKKMKDYLNENGFNFVFTITENGLKAELFYNNSIVKITFNNSLYFRNATITIENYSSYGDIEEAANLLCNNIHNLVVYIRRDELHPYSTYGRLPDFTIKDTSNSIKENNESIPIEKLYNFMTNLRAYRLTSIPDGADERSYCEGVKDMYTDILQFIVSKNLENFEN